MSLKDRIKAKKQVKSQENIDNTVYNISIKKVTKAVSATANTADLGNIIREFAKFLNTLEPQNAKITFSGDFDMGQKTLLNCILSGFLEDKVAKSESDTQTEVEVADAEPKLIKKRKSVKARLEEDSEN